MSESKHTQQCPICGTSQPLTSRVCSNCGATLPGEPVRVVPVPKPEEKDERRPRYDPAEGDDDLYAGEVAGGLWRRVALIGIAVALVLGIGIGAGVMALLRDDRSANGEEPGAQTELLTPAGPTAVVTPPPGEEPAADAPAIAPTEPSVTPRPTFSLATVTPAPPSPTPSPTQGPCMQTASQGDTIYGMAIRCGHRDLSIVDLILEINDMDDPNQLQLGQTLEIPWPTPTGGAVQDESPESDVTSEEGDAVSMQPTQAVNEFGTPDALAQYQNLEPTLRPGMAWHTVQAGETIISIAQQYGTSLETLSQINPEIPFLQCDFGSPTGGERCTVLLGQGQRVRVPVPLPTVTFTPSPVGTLTPTPTPTATFNAPYLLSPNDGAEFRADQMVTLRWGGTGTLGTNERYLVRVVDQQLEREYRELLTDIALILPQAWQPQDGRAHTFEWTVSLVTIGANQDVVSEEYQTAPRRFTWASR